MTLPRFDRNVTLAHHTTFRIGGPAKAFIKVTHQDQVIEAAWKAEGLGLPWQVIGAGSNLLVSDQGYDGAIIVFQDETPPRKNEDGTITVSGGASLSHLIEFATHQGASGLENLAGIPGTVGGAIAGNAGAYGSAISDRLRSVLLLDRNGGMMRMPVQELRFGYRTSSIRDSGKVVLEATFEMDAVSPEVIAKTVCERLEDRRCKHPDWKQVATAGSYFKNPMGSGGVRVAAGKLLEEAGCKGLKVGGASLWPTHANIIVTEDPSRAADVRTLAEMMVRMVEDKWGIGLVPEVLYLE